MYRLFNKKGTIVTLVSVLVLLAALESARFASARFEWPGHLIKPTVSVTDLGGRPLSSFFQALPVDPKYPEFKRLAAAHKRTCGQRLSPVASLVRHVASFFGGSRARTRGVRRL